MAQLLQNRARAPPPPPGDYWTKAQADAVFASDPPLPRVSGLFRMFPATGVDAALLAAPATWGYVGSCLSRPAGSSSSSPSRTPAVPTDMAPSKVSATEEDPKPITKGAVDTRWRSSGVPNQQRDKAETMVKDADTREASYNAAVNGHRTKLAAWEAEEQQRTAFIGGTQQQAKPKPTFRMVHPGERRMMFKAPAPPERVSSGDFGAKRKAGQPHATRILAAILAALYAAHAMGATSHVIMAFSLLLSLPGCNVQWPHRDYAKNGAAVWRRSLSCMLTVANGGDSVLHFYDDKTKRWTTVCVTSCVSAGGGLSSLRELATPCGGLLPELLLPEYDVVWLAFAGRARQGFSSCGTNPPSTAGPRTTASTRGGSRALF